ncbi:MAG: ATP-dependent helicase [Bacteroides sp.]|nr:ATP-dependent helicase [Prevotella sp.]MCM1407385.1 ATP-dependent helicase [Treponema brennaborense]MCM1469875.1 ATP-dependent helicase [Bacteroides sp.]
MNAAEYLSVLNPEQRAAVEHSGSPLLILAGAGSGKTRVITAKIAWLIENGQNPASILAVTFTKKAANEMALRAKQYNPLAAQAQIRTFHSFGSWFLRMYAEEAGIAENFTVYDDEDTATLVKKAAEDIALSVSRQQAAEFARKIALAKDYCLLPDSENLSQVEENELFPEIYAAYQKRLRETGNVDFGDLIMLPMQVLASHENIRAHIHSRFRVIMVDEYQDSNVAQFELLRQLALGGAYVCVVGDDDQSIYKFRGAEVRNILTFQDCFPGTKIIKLERNYRSTNHILAAADAVVRNNSGRLGKTLVAERGSGKKPAVVFLPNQDDETAFCAELIMRAREKGVPYSDWAVFYRTNAQSLGFESEFVRRKIPYTVVGSLKFYEREEIKDILSYLAFIVNPKDEIAFARIINKPKRSIGAASRQKILDIYDARLKEQAEGETLASAPYTLLDACRAAADAVPKKARTELRAFAALIEDLSADIGSSEYDSAPTPLALLAQQAALSADDFSAPALPDNASAFKTSAPVVSLSDFIGKTAEKSGLSAYYSEQDETAETQRLANLEELANSAAVYPRNMNGMLEFLDHIELDRTIEHADEDEADSVTLITVHNTKGLEFPRVLMTGLEYGVFPRRDKTAEELEEERRLFYVGITRARDELYLTSCAMRRLYGRQDFQEASPFLLEIPLEHIDVFGTPPASFRRAERRNTFMRFPEEHGGLRGGADEVPSDFSPAAGTPDFPSGNWTKGSRVYHDDYGYGAILRTELSGGELVISVQFETGEVKQFLPEYQLNKLMLCKD